MMTDCKQCENKNWKQMYITAQQRFDATVTKLTIGFVVLLTITFVCLIITAFLVIKTQKFIDSFEYVEETEIQIEQDCNGKNTVILPDKTEVKTDNGTDLHGEEKEVLEKEENKVNNICIGK